MYWKDIEPLVADILSDDNPDGDRREYDSETIIRWWNTGQIRLATAKPIVSHMMYGGDDGAAVELPKHHYSPKACVMPEIGPIQRLDVVEALLKPEIKGFYILEGRICLSGFGQLPPRWVYSYNAYYSPIEDEDSHVKAPLWSHEALANYVGMQAMAKESIDDARYRQYTAPPDATGNPEHNPYLEVAKYYERRFYDIINAHVDDDGDFV